MDLGWLSHAVSIPGSNAGAIASPVRLACRLSVLEGRQVEPVAGVAALPGSAKRTLDNQVGEVARHVDADAPVIR